MNWSPNWKAGVDLRRSSAQGAMYGISWRPGLHYRCCGGKESVGCTKYEHWMAAADMHRTTSVES